MAIMDDLARHARQSDFAWKELLHLATAPEGRKVLRSFPLAEACQHAKTDPGAIRQLEADGAIAPLPRTDASVTGVSRRYCTIDDLHRVQDALGTALCRRPGDPMLVVPIQAFKGGVGKSMLANTLGHYLALRGARVLLLDLDPQATCTALYGLIPDRELSGEDTVLSALLGRTKALGPVIRRTHFPRLDLIPACQALYDTEYEAPRLSESVFFSMWSQLSEALGSVEDDYDIVLADCPPSLGPIAMNAIGAADAILSPVHPSMIDTASHQAFIQKLRGLLGQIEAEQGAPARLRCLRMVLNNYDPNHETTREIIQILESVYGASLLRNGVPASKEIANAAAEFRSLYELPSPVGTYRTYRRARGHLDRVFGEVEGMLTSLWGQGHGGK
ncbi:MAG: AAA family ATPase [Salinisphaeraceae bacterium]